MALAKETNKKPDPATPKKTLKKVKSTSPPGKTKSDNGHPLFTVVCRDGILLCYSQHRSNSNQSAYLQPILNKIEQEETFATQCSVFGVFNRRNEANAETPKTSGNGNWKVLVRILKNDETLEQCKKEAHLWGRNLARIFTIEGKSFNYPSTFMYHGDATEWENHGGARVAPSVSNYLLNADVLTIINDNYPEDSYSADERTSHCAMLYYGKTDEATLQMIRNNQA